MSLKANLLALLAFLLTCCATPRAAQDYQRDSVTMIIKDSIILKDSVVLVEVPMESDKSVVFSTDTSRLETSVAKSEAYVSDGKLHHTLTNKDALIPVKITLPMQVHTEKREAAMIHKVVEIVEVEKELSRWQSFLITLGYGVLILVVLWLLKKMQKFIV